MSERHCQSIFLSMELREGGEQHRRQNDNLTENEQRTATKIPRFFCRLKHDLAWAVELSRANTPTHTHTHINITTLIHANGKLSSISNEI